MSIKNKKINIDYTKLNYEFSEDMDIFKELIEDYSLGWKEFVIRMNEAIAKKNFSDLHIAAHTLKGIVSNFYEPQVQDLCLKIETLAIEGKDFSNVKELIAEFEELNSLLLKELFSFVQEKKQSA